MDNDATPSRGPLCNNYALDDYVIQETEMLHCSQEIIYTDGSKRDMPGFGTVTGSGVYIQSNTASIELKVHSIGQGTLKTITRAKVATSSEEAEGKDRTRLVCSMRMNQHTCAVDNKLAMWRSNDQSEEIFPAHCMPLR